MQEKRAVFQFCRTVVSDVGEAPGKRDLRKVVIRADSMRKGENSDRFSQKSLK